MRLDVTLDSGFCPAPSTTINSLPTTRHGWLYADNILRL
jgi:hypothetical protein